MTRCSFGFRRIRARAEGGRRRPLIFSTNQLALGRPGKKAILKRRFGGFGVALRGNAIMRTRLKRGFALEPQKNGRGRAGFGGFEADLRENNTKQSGGDH